MKICPKCQHEHDKQGVYCSRTCANSRTWSEESKQKRGKSLKQHIAENPSWKENQLKAISKRVESQKKNLYEKNIVKFNNGIIKCRSALKRWLIETRDESCEICGIEPEWNGVYLSLQVDHINGDSKNNLPDNLRLLCPNCHSQTDTFSGKKHRNKVSRCS